ncbi:MAG: hypothetical protein ABSE91_00395 [Patescibacteria group bacterium]|jgi:hypothetical protein
MNEIPKPESKDLGASEVNLSNEEKAARAQEELDQTLAQMQERIEKDERPGDKEYFSEVTEIIGQIRQLAVSDQEGFIPVLNESKFFWQVLVEKRGWTGLDQTVRDLSGDELRLEIDEGGFRNQGAGIRILRNKEKISSDVEPLDSRDL